MIAHTLPREVCPPDEGVCFGRPVLWRTALADSHNLKDRQSDTMRKIRDPFSVEPPLNQSEHRLCGSRSERCARGGHAESIVYLAHELGGSTGTRITELRAVCSKPLRARKGFCRSY